MNKTGFLQALGIVAYCSAIAGIMSNGNKIFGNIDNSYFGPLAFLTMFATSVLVCGLLVFYKPYLLFFAGKKKEAIEIVVSTTASLFGFLIIFFIILFLTK